MEIIGYVAAIGIGISLGLIGSGGSILTIPILVYLMAVSPSLATTYSLFVVGTSALVGSLKAAREGLLDTKIAIYFGIPSVIAIFTMRKFIVPLLPKTLFQIGSFSVEKDLFIMLIFALLMIFASFSMIKKRPEITVENPQIDTLNLTIRGILIGLLTGFVGVGGGFLIIPTLVFSAKLPMKKAVGTSLIIIAINALIGFLGSLNSAINWTFLLSFSAFSITGIFIGQFLALKISNEKLKPIFGWFVLTMGIYIIAKETGLLSF